MVVLATVDVEDVAVVVSAITLPVLPVDEDTLTFPASLSVPPDIPVVRDPSLVVLSVNGNFPPRGDLRLQRMLNRRIMNFLFDVVLYQPK